MINNFSHIGFFPSASDYRESIGKLLESIRKTVPYKQYGNLKHINFTDESGAGIHIVVDMNNSLVSLDPYFIGESEIEGKLKRVIYNERYHEGGFVIECSNSKDQFPIYFSSKDITEEKDIILHQIKKVQLTAFPREVKFFKNANDPEFVNTKLAEKSFVPSGLFMDQSDEIEKPEAIISGKIKNIKKHINKFSDLPFISILIETLCGSIDVVIDPVAIDHTPFEGDIVAGKFWLSGQLLN
jgi:hypothetical protein